MAIPKGVTDILARATAIRKGAESKLLAPIDAIEQQVINTILSRLNQFAISDGELALSPANTVKWNKLVRDIEEIFKSPKLIKAGRDYLSNFDDLDKLTEARSGLLDIPAKRKLWNDVRGSSVNFFDSQLTGQGLNGQVIEPLMNRLSNLVQTGADMGHIADELTTFMQGRDGLRVHITGLSTDTINQYQGAVDQKIGQEFDLEWVVYAGSIIETSRGQCVRRVKKRYIHKSEFQKEINFALNNKGAKTDEQGKIKKEGTHRIGGEIAGSTPSTFVINRGGHSCRHSATWISEELVPEKDKARVRAAAVAA